MTARFSSSCNSVSITCAGFRASFTYSAGSSDHSTTSIFSPPNSDVTTATRTPRLPTNDPTGSTCSSFECTAIFARLPGSRTTPFATTTPLAISGTSASNSLMRKFGWERVRRMKVPRTLSSTRKSKARTLSVSLARYLFIIGKNGGCAAEVHIEIAALKALNVACDYFSLALAIFGDYACALRLAYFLHYDLLCRLCGDTAEFLTRLKREGNLLVQHRVFFNASSVFDHDVLFRIETRTVIVVIYGLLVFAAHQRVVHHYFCLPEFHVASLRIECRADYLPTLAVFAAIRCGKRGF